jgi:hypothetical protein
VLVSASLWSPEPKVGRSSRPSPAKEYQQVKAPQRAFSFAYKIIPHTIPHSGRKNRGKIVQVVSFVFSSGINRIEGKDGNGSPLAPHPPCPLLGVGLTMIKLDMPTKYNFCANCL